MWQIASTDPGTPSVAGRLLDAELLVMPDGREQSWGDDGAHKRFAPSIITIGIRNRAGSRGPSLGRTRRCC